MMLDDLGWSPPCGNTPMLSRNRSGLDVSVTVTGTERRLEPYLEVMIFRAVQELLGNASRHSQATLIKVQVDLGNEFIRVNVEDNGKGFSPETLQDSTNLGLNLSVNVPKCWAELLKSIVPLVREPGFPLLFHRKCSFFPSGSLCSRLTILYAAGFSMACFVCWKKCIMHYNLIGFFAFAFPLWR